MSTRREKIRFSTGVHILGPCADRFVSSGYKDEKDIATMIHAHPTLSEAVMEAARAAEGWAKSLWLIIRTAAGYSSAWLLKANVNHHQER